MKKFLWLTLCCLLATCLLISCSHHSNYLNYKVSDSDNYFTIRAKYDKRHSKEVDRFLTKYFKQESDISFMHTAIDADLTLNNGARFYIKKQPGYIFIKFKKEENQPAAFRQIQSLGNQLKSALINQ